MTTTFALTSFRHFNKNWGLPGIRVLRYLFPSFTHLTKHFNRCPNSQDFPGHQIQKKTKKLCPDFFIQMRFLSIVQIRCQMDTTHTQLHGMELQLLQPTYQNDKSLRWSRKAKHHDAGRAETFHSRPPSVLRRRTPRIYTLLCWRVI